MSSIAIKLTSLLIRTVAKPISTTIKAQVKEHEVFRKNCIRFAQYLHRTDVKLRMGLVGENKIKIRPLNDNKAIENGANFLSEFFIFSIAGSLIYYESYRTRKKSLDEKALVQDDISFLQDEIRNIQDQLVEIKKNLNLDLDKSVVIQDPAVTTKDQS